MFQTEFLTTINFYMTKYIASCTRPSITSLRSLNRSDKLVVHLNRLTRLRGASESAGYKDKQIFQSVVQTSLSALRGGKVARLLTFIGNGNILWKLQKKTWREYSSSFMAGRKVNVCARQRLVGRCLAWRKYDVCLQISLDLGKKLRWRNKRYYFSPWNAGKSHIRWLQNWRMPRELAGNAVLLNLEGTISWSIPSHAVSLIRWLIRPDCRTILR